LHFVTTSLNTRRQLNDDVQIPFAKLVRKILFANYEPIMDIFVGKYLIILSLIYLQCESQCASPVLCI